MPWTWNTFLAISKPIVVICMWTAPSCDSSQRSPYGNPLPGAGAVHHIRSRLMQCSINCNDEGTCDERASIGPLSDLPQLGDFSAAVFRVRACKIVQSRA